MSQGQFLQELLELVAVLTFVFFILAIGFAAFARERYGDDYIREAGVKEVLLRALREFSETLEWLSGGELMRWQRTRESMPPIGRDVLVVCRFKEGHSIRMATRAESGKWVLLGSGMVLPNQPDYWSEASLPQHLISSRKGLARRMNGWQRLGVIFSALWALWVVGVVLWAGANNELKSGFATEFLAVLVLPFAIAWPLVYLVIFAVRWVRAGFLSNKDG